MHLLGSSSIKFSSDLGLVKVKKSFQKSTLKPGDLILFSGEFYRGQCFEMISSFKKGVVISIHEEDGDSWAYVLCPGEVLQVPTNSERTETKLIQSH